ncbi:MAG: hypothetical protein ACOC1D_04730 [Prolixibacteraceae bacterium]
MIIEFQTKAESNKRRLDNFQSLTRPVRFLKFLQMMDDFSIFPFKKTGNPHFKIEITMNFNETWGEKVKQFLKLAETHGVRMLLVGGGAVNFHGYQRHSADVDFWIDTSTENLANLLLVINDMGYQLDDFPEQVKNQEQNISIKFTPSDYDLELITLFSNDITFEEAWSKSEKSEIEGQIVYKVLSFDHLIESKLKSQRPKDLLDVQELIRIRKL